MEELKIGSVADVESSCHLGFFLLFDVIWFNDFGTSLYVYLHCISSGHMFVTIRSFPGRRPSPFIAWIICFISKLSRMKLHLFFQIVYEYMRENGLTTDLCEISLMTTFIRKTDH